MELILSGRAGRFSCDWRSYALLRDNVQHFIEFGERSSRFEALHRIANAVDSGADTIDAPALRGEVLRAWYALWKVPMADAAMSRRSRAVLTGSPETRPGFVETVCARRVGWELPITSSATTPVPEVASSFIAAVLALTENVVDGDVLEIRRIGMLPVFSVQKPARLKWSSLVLGGLATPA